MDDKKASIFERHSKGKGYLTRDQLHQALDDLGNELTKKEVSELLQAVDKDHSGNVCIEEFRSLFSSARLAKVFRDLDADESGTLATDELLSAMWRLQIDVTRAEVLGMLKEMDQDGDGQVTLEEFINFYSAVPLATLQRVSRHRHHHGLDLGTDLAPPIPHSDHNLGLFVLAGGLGGVSSRSATAPLERIKLSAQVGHSRRGLTHELRAIVGAEGVRGLFAGNFANCLRVFPFGGLVCLSYSQLNKAVSGLEREPMRHMIAGAGAGCLATTMTYPIDVVRAVITTQPQHQRRSLVATARELVSSGGVRSLFRGLGATLFTAMPFVALQQTSYDWIKEEGTKLAHVRPSPEYFLACGACAGVFAQLIVYPMDLLRRRIQVGHLEGPAPVAAAAAKRATALHATWLGLANQVIKSSGVRGLFAGLGTTLFKVAPSVAISVTVRDAVLGRLKSPEPWQ